VSISRALALMVQNRAGHRCEYCGMSQALQGATFHIEHIHPRTCGGESTPENLALACPSCNLRKADRSHVVDPETGAQVHLSHPREHRWRGHFAWQGSLLLGLTPVGRMTAQAFDFNHPRRLHVREAEAMFGLFPPAEEALPWQLRHALSQEALAKPTRSPTRVVIAQRSDGIPPGYC